MRVVSQDRCESFDFNHTMFWRQDGIIYAHIAGDTRDRVIGRYKSDERADEVFDDMNKAYSDMPLIFQNINPSENFEQALKEMNHRAIITVLPDEPMKIEQINNSVYFMPKE